MSGERCCPGAGSMAHVRGCVNHPEPTPTPVPPEVAETTAGEREVEALARIVAVAFTANRDDSPAIRSRKMSRAVLASDWLAAHDDRVRREEGERAWDEGYDEGSDDTFDTRNANPYRAASVGRGEGL